MPRGKSKPALQAAVDQQRVSSPRLGDLQAADLADARFAMGDESAVLGYRVRPNAEAGPHGRGGTMTTRGNPGDEWAAGAAAALRVFELPGETLLPLPATTGVPFPRGAWDGEGPARLASSVGLIASSFRILERWSDGSVRWSLFDLLLPIGTAAGEEIRIDVSRPADRPFPTGGPVSAGVTPDGGTSRSPSPAPGPLRLQEFAGAIDVDTGAATFRLEAGIAFPFASVTAGGASIGGGAVCRLVAEDAGGRRATARVRALVIEETGPLRACVRLEGVFDGDGAASSNAADSSPPLLAFIARLHFHAGSSSVRLLLTTRNPRRAAHPGGHWELGDAGSVLLRVLTLSIDAPGCDRVAWRAEPTLPVQLREGAAASLEIVQDSSGGENWKSRVHLDRDRRIATTFRGYRERIDGKERAGLRASPWAAIHDGGRGVSIAPRWFWQNFPAAIEAAPGAVALRLFPRQYASLHEIQGGEQKTHEVVLAFGEEASAPERSLPPDPPLVRPTPAAFAASGAIPYLVPRAPGAPSLHDRLVGRALEGPDTFEAKRERADESGWRHFGELWADHEARFHEGPESFVAHYHNQYDVVYGAFLPFARTGDPRWHRIHEELARHVVDVDVYHTTEDKPAYNQGLFWHTVHYVDADLSTHRSYPKRGSQGGGPDDEHNYTTGLLHRYLAGGDAQARETVIASAAWVIDADDGERTIFRWLDRGRTGLATKTRAFDYHGPGRGAGNSLNALLDGWRLTRDERFLVKAREVTRRVIHPAQDVARLDLLDAENRWSYTVFLQALGKSLDTAEEAGRIDEDYAYARASLLAFARWMADHERPILDAPDRLEYPTETWAAQDVRKSDVFLFAALHSEGADRARFLERAGFFFHRSLRDLDAFPT